MIITSCTSMMIHGMKTQSTTVRSQDILDGIPRTGKTTDSIPAKRRTTDDGEILEMVFSSSTSMMSRGIKIGMTMRIGLTTTMRILRPFGRLGAGGDRPSRPRHNGRDRRDHHHHPHSHHQSRLTQGTPWRKQCAKAGCHISSHESRQQCCWAYLKNPLSKSCAVLGGTPYCSGTLTATLAIRMRKQPCAWWWLQRTCWVRAREVPAKVFKNIVVC